MSTQVNGKSGANGGSACAAESRAGLAHSLSYDIVRRAVRPLLRLVLNVRVEGRRPLNGAHVLVANHASFLDPIVLGSLAPRPVTFMMTQLHFRSAVLGWFYRWSRAIPLAVRGMGNRGALRAGRAVLQRGELLAIFPEGGLTRDGGLYLGNPGAVSLAMTENVPIVPVYIGGAFESLPIGGRLRRRRITLRFGEPISQEQLAAGAADRRSRLQVATRAIMAAIAELGDVDSRDQELERLAESRSRRG